MRPTSSHHVWHNSAVQLLTTGRLSVRFDAAGMRIGTHDHPDWYGPANFVIDQTVVDDLESLGSAEVYSVDPTKRIQATIVADVERPDVVICSLEALVDIDRDATGFGRTWASFPSFDPTARLDGGQPDDTAAFGHQYMEFALPTAADAQSLSDWLRWPFRPAVVEPLWLIAPDGFVIMLAPINAVFDQIISVPEDVDDASWGIRCGWHGDLTHIPVGTRTELAIIGADGTRAAQRIWAEMLAERGGRIDQRPPDVLGDQLSYWTDNGSAYWYRTEGDATVSETLSSTLADLRERNVPYGAVQLDSWFYPHAVVRPFNTDEWLVPPTGLIDWDARTDILPDGIAALRNSLGDPPLITHTRHLSSESSAVERFECWIDGPYAHPQHADYYEELLARAAGWGVEVFEHDWLIECFLGVEGLRAEPGRAEAWQRGIDAALAERDMTAQWCMGSPADMMMASTLARVTSVRTSGDHGYMVGPGALWAWFCYSNSLARTLGLSPFKDVFRTDGAAGSVVPEVEALLSAWSAGPVGIGDPRGAVNADLVSRVCRADGVLVAPDVPVAAIDASFRAHAFLRPALMVAATHSLHDVGQYSYVVALNVCEPAQSIAGQVQSSMLGEDAPTSESGTAVRWIWGRDEVDLLDIESGSWPVTLDHLGSDVSILAPVVDVAGTRVAFIGDAGRYASAGRQRCRAIRTEASTLRVELAGSPGESFDVIGWSDGELLVAVTGTGGVVDRIVEPGVWRVAITIDESGSAQLSARSGSPQLTETVMI